MHGASAWEIVWEIATMDESQPTPPPCVLLDVALDTCAAAIFADVAVAPCELSVEK